MSSPTSGRSASQQCFVARSSTPPSRCICPLSNQRTHTHQGTHRCVVVPPRLEDIMLSSLEIPPSMPRLLFHSSRVMLPHASNPAMQPCRTKNRKLAFCHDGHVKGGGDAARRSRPVRSIVLKALAVVGPQRQYNWGRFYQVGRCQSKEATLAGHSVHVPAHLLG